MQILMAASEATPFSKTGGLADVSSALSKALVSLGHQVTLVTPHYPQNIRRDIPLETIRESIEVPLGNKWSAGRLLRPSHPESSVNVILIDQPDYFDRPGLYQENGVGYPDNCERFVYFSRAVLEAARVLRLQPDVIHANDWQTGLLPALLKIECRGHGPFGQTASVLTVHNLAFQGNFWHWDMPLTGLDWKHFNVDQLEYFGSLSLLKAGIVFADMLTTVSPTYAQEIRTPRFGWGFEGIFQANSAKLVGILNGIDPEVWNPTLDPAIAKRYTVETVREGKLACKGALQERLGLAARSDCPLFGMISRMTDQKGFDLIEELAESLVTLDAQFVFLGSGEEHFEEMARGLAARSPDKIAAVIGFDEELAHQIEAGADAFLMPSRFEPCGLNQMYSLAYGTLPVVHKVGGLADSVIDATPENLANGTANGFVFEEYTATAFLEQLQRAIACFSDNLRWQQLVGNGMKRDWSWERSAAEYVSVYERAAAKVTSPRGA